jgi:hypothetical protein
MGDRLAPPAAEVRALDPAPLVLRARALREQVAQTRANSREILARCVETRIASADGRARSTPS